MTVDEGQNIFLYNRTRLEASGICDVTSFSDESVEMALKEGCLALDGEGLKIESFSCDSGKICVLGKIGAITYYNKTPVRSLFKKKNG